MRVLVTGGAGYIGSITTELLLSGGHQVTVLDNLSTGHRAAIHPDATFLEVDLLDASATLLACQSDVFNAVLHFGGLIQVGESMAAPTRYFRNNVSGSINLLDAVVQTGIPRFVFSSTGTVYAPRDDAALTEADPIGPENPYAESKATVERMLDWVHRQHGLQVAVLRYFNAAGASSRYGEDHHPESHLIPNVLSAALEQIPALTIHGTDYPTHDGTCIRDYIHVVDLAEAHVLALDHLPRLGWFTGNLGSERGYSVREVIDAARAITGRPIPAVEGPRRPGDAVRIVADSRLARETLGWEPRQADLGTILGSAWEWRRQHPDGYGDRG